MDRNDQYRRSRRDRQDRDYGRQSEQFSDSDYGRDDEQRNSGQMGESRSRNTYGEFDNDSYSGSGYGASQGRKSDRDDDRSYGRDRGGYGQQGRYSERGSGASYGGYGPSGSGNQGRGGFGSFNSNDFGGRDFAGPEQNYGGGRSPSNSYGSTYASEGRYGAARPGDRDRDYRNYQDDRDRSRRDQDDRGFFARAGDEVASWFGDDDAARRREMDHSGRGPTNYTRSDERILEDACDHLTDDRGVDAQNIQVTVENGEITLDGTVTSRQQKRRAEDCVYGLSGVKHVQNNLRIKDRSTELGRTGSDRTSQSDQSTYNRNDSTTGTLA